MKHIVFGRIAALVLAGLTASIGPAATQEHTLRIGSVQAETDPIIRGFNEFKRLVEDRSNGRIEILVYPNGQLGDTQEVQDQALAGGNVAAFTDPNLLATFKPEFGIIGAPYVFESYEEADRFTSSETFKNWAEDLRAASGFVTLAFNWYQGPRNLMTNKPIASRADVSGLRIRTPGAPVWVAAGKALGGTPTPMAWGEVYSALQLGAIDGVEAQPSGAVGSKFHEVTKHVTKTEHIHLITGIVVGDLWWKTLSAEDQALVQEAAVEGGRFMSQIVLDQMEQDFATMTAAGVTIADIDKTEFKAAAAVELEALGLVPALEAVKLELGRN
ncbi:MAG: C4-dicarboxylate TRAP transporter substrate-binding protein [Hoeflea sp.]|uniref:C4-dicarboxylate TRAP transporter substrate-binding protein n=1 Tax=Hoeflea sp. TaxID=1940281 RepID=UPI00272F3FC8|nr:C4-dicarboxylate TRAP transporter substrate-binding protein [Hoeflea sp.]MDP2118590.1 C4-dicarboxylate TRAP transporter substrate-binding protein [Hoeflea sp.]